MYRRVHEDPHALADGDAFCSPPHKHTSFCFPEELMSLVEEDGYLEVPGGEVWYRKDGSGPGHPLLALHGGPGMPSDYLEPLFRLADERPVITYDQLGCGNSEIPDDDSLWRLDRSLEELKEVRAGLGLKRFHLLGHSWGSMLATEYALGQPDGLVSLLLASPCLSVTRWMQDVSGYRRELPPEVQETLDRHEAAGTLDSAEYEEATMIFYRRHFCRLDPWPDPLLRTWRRISMQVYTTMWGPTEFVQTGNLGEFERVDRLPEIGVPTLFTCGRHDEATPDTTSLYQSQVPNSELVIFEESSHTPHLEEAEAYLATVRAFLHKVESSP